MKTYGFLLRVSTVLLIVLVVLTAGAVTGGRPAWADGAPAGQDLHISQTLGARELTVVVRRADAVPGPLRVDVITHAGTPAGRLALRVIPTGASTAAGELPAAGSVVAEGTLDLGAVPGYHGVTLRVDRPGPWELAVDDGERVARIPFIVPARVVTPPEFAAYVGFTAAGALLLVALALVVWARRWWLSLFPAGGMVAAAAVGVTGALLSATTPLPPQAGPDLDPTIDNVTAPYSVKRPPLEDLSRPPVNMHLRPPEEASAGRRVEFDLLLTDGATGRPVDDLLVHDSALIHLIVVSPSGRLWHLHPVRIGRGHYQVSLVAGEAGHYAVTAEVARRGGGVQLLRSATGFEVGPGLAHAVPAPEPKGLGLREVDGTAVDLSVTGGAYGEATGIAGSNGTPGTPGTPGTEGVSGGSAAKGVSAEAGAAKEAAVEPSATEVVAGQATTINAKIGDTADLQPWLGMEGHMIVVGPLPEGKPVGKATESAPIWAHVHAMGAVRKDGVGGQPDETVAAFGPTVRFTYTFPQPGRYRLWVQAERNYSIVTVPAILDVGRPEGGDPPA
ncbi:hypothetical protein [Sinosporangium siamense]|uniref:Uncharacterized protein n=1 Tax=Sinosporangium siamense TaxID=1367973 RepID=A0A919RPC4_9ACTN|nr:hypothetical protein [Sinosporangium siamense]GII97393.1 hypothetical protein Ssi02_76240 [Sinosporangium siamense]